MPSSTYNTPGVANIAKLAEKALAAPSGLEIAFTAARYGSLALARGAARSFQSYFSNLRAIERKRIHKAALRVNPRANVALLETPFDDLVCSKRDLPNNEGFAILMQPSYMVDFGEVIDIETGEPLKMHTREAHLSKVALVSLMNAAQEAEKFKKPLINPLSAELERVWFDTKPESARSWYETYNLPLPLYVDGPHNLPASNDPNDIPIDADPFTYGKDTSE